MLSLGLCTGSPYPDYRTLAYAICLMAFVSKVQPATSMLMRAGLAVEGIYNAIFFPVLLALLQTLLCLYFFGVAFLAHWLACIFALISIMCAPRHAVIATP